MTDAATTVDRAAGWARVLVKTEHERGNYDSREEAMGAVASRLCMSISTLWALAYRKPKEIAAHNYLRLQCAYAAECERQRRLFEHERQITEAMAGFDAPLVRAAVAVAREKEE